MTLLKIFRGSHTTLNVMLVPGLPTNRILVRIKERNYNLPHLGIRLEIFVGFRGLRKRESLRDLWVEAAIGQAVEDILPGDGEFLWVERNLHQHIAANSESLGDHREQGKRRGLRGERAILKDNPAGRSSLS